MGFSRASTTATEQTPRNLFGFKDGTANITASEQAALEDHVWAAPEDGTDWMAGGSYRVARCIRMLVEIWDRTPLDEQQQLVGRTKDLGAPLRRSTERAEVDLARLPPSSHVALVHSSRFGGTRMLRRSYSFVDGSDRLGHLDAGLLLLAYQRDPRRAFVPMQRALARSDGLNEYLRHTGSGVWACPPGVEPGGWWGQTLLA